MCMYDGYDAAALIRHRSRLIDSWHRWSAHDLRLENLYHPLLQDECVITGDRRLDFDGFETRVLQWRQVKG